MQLEQLAAGSRVGKAILRTLDCVGVMAVPGYSSFRGCMEITNDMFDRDEFGSALLMSFYLLGEIPRAYLIYEMFK